MLTGLFDDKSPSHSKLLTYVVNHSFFPVHHPVKSDHGKEQMRALAHAVHVAARAYNECIDDTLKPHWLRVTKMLKNLEDICEVVHVAESQLEHEDLKHWHLRKCQLAFQDCAITQFAEMTAGDTLILPYDYKDTGLATIFRKDGQRVLCKLPMFEESLLTRFDVFEIPNQTFHDAHFRHEVASYFSGQSRVLSLHGIFRSFGVGCPEPQSVSKRYGPSRTKGLGALRYPEWSRSLLWFHIRYTIHSSIDHFPRGHSAYKEFLLFFLCHVADYATKVGLSEHRFQSILAKILRRFRKLGSPAPQWLYGMVLATCTNLAHTLDQKWQDSQLTPCVSPPWDPSQLELFRDTRSALPDTHEYISASLANLARDIPHAPFLPNCRVRNTLEDFLSHPDSLPAPSADESSHSDSLSTSSADDPLHLNDIRILLYDVERAVGEDLDGWLARITGHVDSPCEQLAGLVHRYHPLAQEIYADSPDHSSIMFLTVVELWIAIDKLTIKEIPILADYSPGVGLDSLCWLVLRDTLSIHRFSRAYQYIIARHSRAQAGWSVFSNDFTENSFPCRYYDRSPDLQCLAARIHHALPSKPSFAKVVVFELHCPASFDRWLSVTCLISDQWFKLPDEPSRRNIQVYDLPVLTLSIRDDRWSPYLLCSSPAPRRWNRLYYVRNSSLRSLDRIRPFQLSSGPYSNSPLQQYLKKTTHTSNSVLAAHTHHDSELSLHEFIAFAQLRSGGSLQWLNILRELRSRTLSFHHPGVYILFAQASAQVGETDCTVGLTWHQEIQDPSFCHALLDELESLFAGIIEGSMDVPAMAIISLLAALLASRSSTDISERAFQLLWDVRKKTFGWVHESLYNMRRSPMNKGDRELLGDVAAVCRSTFDVGSVMSHKLFLSPWDIEVVLSCAMIIRTIMQGPSLTGSSFTEILLNKDRRLSLVLEEGLRDAIQADTSDVGVDRAVQMVWPGYRSSPRRWEPLQPPDSRWLVCETAPSGDGQSQMVHVNLLDGSLLVDGQPLGYELPRDVTSNPTYKKLFGERSLIVVPSDMQGMNFVTVSLFHRSRVHFAVRRDDSISSTTIIRTQNIDTHEIHELIPRKKLYGDLPFPLFEGHIHWLDRSTSVVEIRPIAEPWKQSSQNWKMYLGPKESFVMKGGELLVDKHSPTWKIASSRFRSLDDPDTLLVTASLSYTTTQPSPSYRLSIILPYHGLSFFVNEDGDLESRDFKAMVYDEEQDVGTLYGLSSRLVLRPKAQIEANLVPKRILIACQRYVGDPAIYSYQVDAELGCLKGAASLDGTLFLARMHYKTCRWLRPDPLMGRTGVEEALSLIWLAGTRQGPNFCRSDPHSPLIDSASRRLCRNSRDEPYLLRYDDEQDCLREAYLFPSEVSAALRSSRKGSVILLDQLLRERPPPNLPERNTLPPYDTGSSGLSQSPDIDTLRQLVSSLIKNEPEAPFHGQYISRLRSSEDHLQALRLTGSHGTSRGISSKLSTERLRQHYVQCRNTYTDGLKMVKDTLRPFTEFEQVSDQCGQWPRITPFILFRCLASTSPIKPPENWKKCLIYLALLALDVQRARRLLVLSLDELQEELNTELENDVCDGWDPAEYPDWLLIQLQGNFLVRGVQAKVAKEMISPRSRKNTVFQVNMGEGKTSVITPLCAAALADGDQLVCVVVPKELIPQTKQVLRDRLGGLIGKPIYHLTFSRSDMEPGPHSIFNPHWNIHRLHELLSDCRDEGGIIVTQPEHLLSLKLACVETLLPEVSERLVKTKSTPTDWQMWGKPVSAIAKQGFSRVLQMITTCNLMKSLPDSVYASFIIGNSARKDQTLNVLKESIETEIDAASDLGSSQELLTSRPLKESKVERNRDVREIQGFIEKHARYIIDESDDVLRPQFQLIHAIGHQQPLEGSPDRWTIVQQVLGLVKQHAGLLSTPSSRALRCDVHSPGSFPHIHVLWAEGGKQLASLIAESILDAQLSNITLHSGLGLTGAIREFILNKDIHPGIAKTVERYARQTTTWDSLLLLRGLLAHDILLFALTQRRWRVDYGLDRARTMLAIPYRAKDVPTKTAEFGHPDITLLLTCLSYYYGGLEKDQLETAFELLLHQDNPCSDYALWVKDCDIASLPDYLQKLDGVNIRSFDQWNNHLVPLFSRNKRAIDLYLSKVVFPKHAKEFRQRLSSSAWDLAELKNHLVTGFSGTNDTQYLLPTSIVQDDPTHLHQLGTNAKVLANLLHPENSSYMVTADENDERWDTRTLLKMIVAERPEIRVLLDVGAQVLDLSNLELAQAWLDITLSNETAGAIYFDEDDHMMILTRNGTTRPLSSSPLAQQLHRCIAYLDHAHTRGTDLKFPRGFRAAVTLGHKVTKDRLVQGCMRMRKLGNGHSVMFFVPLGVDRRIRASTGKESLSIPVTTTDILHWAIRETWSEIQRLAPTWAHEGAKHQSRYETWSRFRENPDSSESRRELADAWIQPESKSLGDMYMPCHSSDATFTKLPRQIRERCENLGVLSVGDVHMNEEEEREVSREIERERDVNRPPTASPAEHSLHPDVVMFVRTGIAPSPSRSKAFRHVFATNDHTSSKDLRAWSPSILATADFCETIVANDEVKGRMNEYLRPVQWVLSGKMQHMDALVLVSPFEADKLMPEIRVSKHVHLHLYIPRTTKSMKPADDLRLYAIPPLPSDWIPPWPLIDQLNIFAGQLYLSDYASYVRVGKFLGVHTEDLPQKPGTVVERNWFSNPDVSDEEIKNRFEGTPLPLAVQLLVARRGMDFAGTHMGRIIDGGPLTEEDFESSDSVQ